MTYPQGLRLLIDGDILRYRCAFAAEKTLYLVSGLTGEAPEYITVDNHKKAKETLAAFEMPGHIWSRKEVQPVEFALHATNTVLESLVAKFEPSVVDVYLSDSPTFRHRLAKTKPYKGNRSESDKPVYYKEVGDFLLNKGAIVKDDIEADDCMAIEASKDPKGTIIVTIDKDLLQIPGNHFNWVTNEFIVQSKKASHFELAAQLLSGDSTDNVPGIPGVGPVVADRLIKGAKNSEELFKRVLEIYESKCGLDWQNYFVEQFKLLYLLRDYGQKDSFPEIETISSQV